MGISEEDGRTRGDLRSLTLRQIQDEALLCAAKKKPHAELVEA
jgi:hypothetical protein